MRLQVDVDPRNPVYIAAQGPLQHTADDFWQASIDMLRNVSVLLFNIVVLVGIKYNG